MRSARALVAAVFAGFALIGCSNQTATPRDDAAGTVRAFLQACSNNDSRAVLDTLDVSSQGAFFGARTTFAGCRAAVGLPVSGPAALDGASVSVGSVRSNDASAQIMTGATHFQLDLEFHGDGWRVAAPPAPSGASG